ncbi:MAG: aconitate hydratase AcnA [Anaerolineae bacterium]|nr:aconitate hydratase AcnA [Anaerolineae bacterium]
MSNLHNTNDPFGAHDTLQTANGPVVIYRLDRIESQGIGNLSRLPYAIRVLLEAALRQLDGFSITGDDVANLAAWKDPGEQEIPYRPARVVLQDFTGVPSVVDLAALRSAMARLSGDPSRINPIVPADLVIDHSVQVDRFGSAFALAFNAEREFERNRERYEFLRWGKEAFDNFRVVPPATGIIHQVNLEFLAKGVLTREVDGETVAFPDTLVGTDSHTTMINALGVLGWGVGGIEAEAAMLGQPIYMLMPEVVGFKMIGALPEGATATDLVLTVTQMLRKKGVVGRFVEYYGPGISQLSLADRATIANMAPDYGATMGFFPVDDETLRYLRATNRGGSLADLVERYTKEQHLFRTDGSPDPAYEDTIELDLGTVEPSIAGPKRPNERIPLTAVKGSFHESLSATTGNGSQPRKVAITVEGEQAEIGDGAVVLAAITSCTNTSNPSVMVGAGLLAKKAVEKGLSLPPHVKPSLAPGSKIVSRYLRDAGLLPYLEQLRYHVVGYGCTTCIGNSGPLDPAVAGAIQENDLVVAAVLSGNRNFEGRVNPLTRLNYLASPPLVIAYALAGTVDIDFETEPLGTDPNGEPVYLRDIWPTQAEIRETIQAALKPELFEEEYANVFDGNEMWNELPVPEGDIYTWPKSTYIHEPPFFIDITAEESPIAPIQGARALALLGDSVTTDHISPAGPIPADGPAGEYLIELGIEPRDFNTFGARRGNHIVMMRGGFSNIRLRNRLVPGTEGGVTVYLPEGSASREDGEEMSIYHAAMRYMDEETPLVVIAGTEYGTGSSRDWAAKATYLLGIKAVLATSYERIHRSNLVGMGVLPLQFKPGENAETLGLTGFETYDIEGLNDDLQPRQEVTVRARRAAGNGTVFTMICRVDSPVEVRYYRNGGILHTVLRDMLRED